MIECYLSLNSLSNHQELLIYNHKTTSFNGIKKVDISIYNLNSLIKYWKSNSSSSLEKPSSLYTSKSKAQANLTIQLYLIGTSPQLEHPISLVAL